jgi:hypothetical protein
METGERAEPAAAATCVVWRPMGVLLPPQPLVEALAARGFDTIHCDDAFEALARLCVCAGGREPGKRAVSLVVVDRDQLGEIDDFLDALETYTPAVVPWDYDDAHGLRPLVVEEAIEPEREPLDESAGEQIDFAREASTFAPHRLKISEEIDPGEQPLQAAPDDAGGDAGGDAGTEAGIDGAASGQAEPTISELLTDEELAMLLGEDEPPAETESGEQP